MEVSDEAEEMRQLREIEKEEPLLQENPRRFVLFPIEHADIWTFYKKAVGEDARLSIKRLASKWASSARRFTT